MNLTSIEKKVIKNTLLTNSNCLQTKERSHSHMSLFSRQSKQCSTIFQADLSISRSSLFESLLKIKPESKDSFKSLQKTLDELKPEEVLTLPAEKTVISSLVIKKSVHIKGVSGSSLVIEDSGFHLASPRIKVFISELKVSVTGTSGVLVSAGEVDLEVADCVVVGNEENRFISFDDSDGVRMGRVSLSSCDVTGFSEVIKSSEGCSVLVNRCHLSSCSGHGLFLFSPSLVQITMNLIEKCKKSGIEIVHTSSKSTSSIKQDILIEENDIVHNHGPGVSIYSDTFHELSGSITIKSNKISHNKKEGISIRHLGTTSLICSNNDFTYNTLSSCWIQKLQHLSNSEFEISSNRFSDSLLGYGLYVYSAVFTLTKNEIFRNSLGGVFITGKCSSSDLNKNFMIMSCCIDSNGGNGVEINDFSNSVIVESSKLSENTKSGLCCMNSLKYETGKTRVEAKYCEMSCNSEYGVVVVRCRCNFLKLNITDNSMGEMLFGENSSELVRFDDRLYSTTSDLIAIKAQKSCRGSCIVY